MAQPTIQTERDATEARTALARARAIEALIEATLSTGTAGSLNGLYGVLGFAGHLYADQLFALADLGPAIRFKADALEAALARWYSTDLDDFVPGHPRLVAVR